MVVWHYLLLLPLPFHQPRGVGVRAGAIAIGCATFGGVKVARGKRHYEATKKMLRVCTVFSQ